MRSVVFVVHRFGIRVQLVSTIFTLGSFVIEIRKSLYITSLYFPLYKNGVIYLSQCVRYIRSNGQYSSCYIAKWLRNDLWQKWVCLRSIYTWRLANLLVAFEIGTNKLHQIIINVIQFKEVFGLSPSKNKVICVCISPNFRKKKSFHLWRLFRSLWRKRNEHQMFNIDYNEF